MLQRIRTSLQRTTDHAKDRGASAVEYGLMIAAIAAVIVGAVFGLGGLVSNAFEGTKQCLEDGAAAASPDCAKVDAPKVGG